MSGEQWPERSRGSETRGSLLIIYTSGTENHYFTLTDIKISTCSFAILIIFGVNKIVK
jgi:hypothetical protein